MRPTILMVTVLFAGAVVACDGEADVEETLEEIQETTGVDTMEQEAEPPSERVTIRATSYEFEPSTITVPAGRVAFVIENAADIVHGFEVEGHGLEKAIDEIPAGVTDSLTVEFETPGEYTIYCPVGDHESRGMTGTLTVK